MLVPDAVGSPLMMVLAAAFDLINCGSEQLKVFVKATELCNDGRRSSSHACSVPSLERLRTIPGKWALLARLPPDSAVNRHNLAVYMR